MDARRCNAPSPSFGAAGSRRRALALALSGALSVFDSSGSGDATAGGKCKPRCAECKSCKKGRCKGGKCRKTACKPKPNGTACSVGSCQRGRCITDTTPPPPRCGTGGPCLVFVTSTTHQGNLGGLAGADLICRQRAQARGVAGTYKAWLSDSTGSPDSRFMKSTGPYQRLDGVTVADNYTDLTTCDRSDPFACLDNPIDLMDDGVTRTNSAQIWTNTGTGGTEESPARSCDNWTKADGSLIANIGISDPDNATGASWTDQGSVQFCDFDFTRLYCFQQS